MSVILCLSKRGCFQVYNKDKFFTTSRHLMGEFCPASLQKGVTSSLHPAIWFVSQQGRKKELCATLRPASFCAQEFILVVCRKERAHEEWCERVVCVASKAEPKALCSFPIVALSGSC